MGVAATNELEKPGSLEGRFASGDLTGNTGRGFRVGKLNCVLWGVSWTRVPSKSKCIFRSLSGVTGSSLVRLARAEEGTLRIGFSDSFC